eukprot:gene7387-8207_t
MATISFSKTDINRDDFYGLKVLTLTKIISPIPALSMFLCVSVSLLLHWEESTETHCKVANYLPSISAAIGGFAPQRYIWRLGIALHCGPRFLVALAYHTFYKQLTKQIWINNLARLAAFLNITELLSLLGLSYVSSTENFDFHEAAFICFIACSLAYMVITCIILHFTSKSEKNHQLQVSFTVKLKILVFYVSCFAMSVYLYFRHNTYCEAGVYTLFALCEYLVVLSNIAFHSTVIYDFGESVLSIGPLFMEFSSAHMNNLERKVKREIANSNERRRMQNINTGFDHLKELVCKDPQEKISKASVLRKTIDYLDAMEEYNKLLIQQNRKLKKLLSESDKGEMVNNFSSPVKRKVEGKQSKRATKCRKLICESETEQDRSKDIFLHQIYDFSNTNQESVQVIMKKHEQTPSSFNEEAFPIKGARRSLDSIIEAINQLEGEERLNSIRKL